MRTDIIEILDRRPMAVINLQYTKPTTQVKIFRSMVKELMHRILDELRYDIAKSIPDTLENMSPDRSFTLFTGRFIEARQLLKHTVEYLVKHAVDVGRIRLKSLIAETLSSKVIKPKPQIYSQYTVIFPYEDELLALATASLNTIIRFEIYGIEAGLVTFPLAIQMGATGKIIQSSRHLSELKIELQFVSVS